MMNGTLVALVIILVIIVAAVVLVAALVSAQRRQRRSEALHERFGPEYDRTVARTWDRERAEDVLEQRAKRVERLDIHPLSAVDRARFAESWRSVQSRFVDDPQGAVRQADQLIGEVMQARGYPMGNFEQRAADVSVGHPRVVENYRTAHAVAQRSASGDADTEDLRKATVAYRSLFDDLLEDPETAQKEVRS